MTFWERHEAVVGSLYEAVTTPDAMNGSMRDVALLYEAVDAVLLIMNTTTGFIEQQFYWTAPEDDGLYDEYYFRLDPRLSATADLPAGQVWRCEKDFNTSFVRRDVFYNEYLIPAGVRYTMGGKLAQAGERLVFFALHRAPDQPGFSDAEEASLQHLYPHLARSARLFIEFERLRGGWGGPVAETMMGSLNRALMVTDSGARLHFANTVSEQLLQKGKVFSVRKGILACLRSNDQAVLKHALDQASRYSTGCEQIIGRESGEPLLLRVVPLPCDFPERLSRRILLSLSPLRQKRSIPAEVVSEFWGLTRKEAALACALADGETLNDYAARNNVTYGTVRSQLHSIFEKTNVSRQPELVALICRLPDLSTVQKQTSSSE